MKIAFLGMPQFGSIILKKLSESEYEPSSINQFNKIPDIKPDLIILANYGRIVPKEILAVPKYGILNVHPSLLPKYRGPSPIQNAILNGDKETGVSIILLDEQIDHGPILAQKKTIIGPNETFQELHDRLAVMGAELLIDIIPDWLENKIQLAEQDEKKATYTKILTREDGLIDWKKPVEAIERQIRAFAPWPGTYTFWEKNVIKITGMNKKTKEVKKNRLKILKASPPTGGSKNKLIIDEVQPEGKNPMSFKNFIQGNRDFLKNKTICSHILI